MRHWMFVGSLIILGTVFVLRNKTQDPLSVPTTRGITVDQLKAATQRAADERRSATAPATTRVVGVLIDKVRAIRISPASQPTTAPNS